MLACQNGICQKNGFCKCSLDYTGLTCSTCKWIWLILKNQYL